MKLGSTMAARSPRRPGATCRRSGGPRARDGVRRRKRLPGLDPRPVNELTCLYTTTANEDFILDRQGPFVIASPCSGHGAKFAPLLGEVIADLAAGRPPRMPASPSQLTAPEAPASGLRQCLNFPEPIRRYKRLTSPVPPTSRCNAPLSPGVTNRRECEVPHDGGHARAQSGLQKGTDWWGAFVIGLAGVILVTGIAPYAVQGMGAAAIWAIGINTVFGLVLCLCLAELACMWPDRTGGIPSYAAASFEPLVGRTAARHIGGLSGWSYWLGWFPVAPINMILTAAYLATLFPSRRAGRSTCSAPSARRSRRPCC